jgi:hypothetical protein
MPVEIRELIIRAVVTEADEDEPGRAVQPEIDKETVIEECVQQVLKILKRKEER